MVCTTVIVDVCRRVVVDSAGSASEAERRSKLNQNQRMISEKVREAMRVWWC